MPLLILGQCRPVPPCLHRAPHANAIALQLALHKIIKRGGKPAALERLAQHVLLLDARVDLSRQRHQHDELLEARHGHLGARARATRCSRRTSPWPLPGVRGSRPRPCGRSTTLRRRAQRRWRACTPAVAPTTQPW